MSSRCKAIAYYHQAILTLYDNQKRETFDSNARSLTLLAVPRGLDVIYPSSRKRVSHIYAAAHVSAIPGSADSARASALNRYTAAPNTYNVSSIALFGVFCSSTASAHQSAL